MTTVNNQERDMTGLRVTRRTALTTAAAAMTTIIAGCAGGNSEDGDGNDGDPLYDPNTELSAPDPFLTDDFSIESADEDGWDFRYSHDSKSAYGEVAYDLAEAPEEARDRFETADQRLRRPKDIELEVTENAMWSDEWDHAAVLSLHSNLLVEVTGYRIAGGDEAMPERYPNQFVAIDAADKLLEHWNEEYADDS